MNDTVGIISLNPHLCAQSKDAKLLGLCGDNTGNLLFTEAVFSQVSGAVHISSREPEKLTESCSHICIPAANWIYPGFDFGWLGDMLERANLPVCCVGLGAQTGIQHIRELKEGTLRFLKILSAMSKSIGVRGSDTAKVLSELGITNVDVVGCPSMFQSFTVPKVEIPAWDSQMTTGMSFTRFGLAPSDEGTAQCRLARYTFEHADVIYFQSEIPEIKFLANEGDISPELARYYGHSQDVVRTTLASKGRCFNNLEDWIDDLKACSLIISSRIHGCISAILAGVPAVLLTHDLRTGELAESMAIAHEPIAAVDDSVLGDKSWLGAKLEFYRDVEFRWRLNRQRLIDFYRFNDVPIKLDTGT